MNAAPSTRARVGLAVLAALLAAAPRPVAAQLHLGLEAGLHGDLGGVEGLELTELKRAAVWGPSLGYRFGFGLDLELAVRRFAPRLVKSGINPADWGTLDLTLVLLRGGYQFKPRREGPAFHGAMGFGFAMADFREGPFLKDLARQYGHEVDFMTRGMDSFAFDAEAGFDWFLNPYLALTANLRLVLVRQDFKVFPKQAAVDLGMTDPTSNPTFVLLGGDVTVGLRLYFWR